MSKKNLNNNISKYKELFLYIFSRFFVILFIKILLGVIRNNKEKIEIFFGYGFWKNLAGWLVVGMTIIILIFVINLVFTIIRLLDNGNKISSYVNKNDFILNLKKFVRNFYNLLIKNFNYEINKDTEQKNLSENEVKESLLYEFEKVNENSFYNKSYIRRNKFSIIFYILGTLSLLLFQDNSLFSKYYAVYNYYLSGVTREGDAVYSKEPLIVIKKEKWNPERLKITLYSEYSEDEELDLGKKKYLFKEAAYFQGFKSHYAQKGLLAYYHSFLMFILEKFIPTVLYFLIPFLIIVVYSFFDDKKYIYLYSLFLFLLLPILLFYGYPWKINFLTSIVLVIITLINFLPFLPQHIFSIKYSSSTKEKLIKIVVGATSLLLIIFIAYEMYIKHSLWRILIAIPLLLWWLIVFLIQDTESKEMKDENNYTNYY